MTKRDKHAAIRAFSQQYKQAKRKSKSELLNRLVVTTGYSRKHLIEILPNLPKVPKRKRRIQHSVYLQIAKTLRILWAVSNYACGQRLKPVIPNLSATIDRLLVHDRKRINLKGRSRTKPGSLLKHQIPIKMWTDWDRARPGFVEVDSVHHCGVSLFGDYLFTLNAVDVATGWNECCAHLGKSEYRTTEALEIIKKRLPFPLLGIDFDCGGEFVNWHFLRYCNRNHITYTRARETIKNDQNYVEQQNYSVVRRFVGYQRLDTQEQLEILNNLYKLLSDYQNFFQPVMKLKEKVRDGTKRILS